MASTASTPLEEIDGNTGKTVAADLDRKGVTDCIPLSENVQEPVKGEKGVKETVSKKAVVEKVDVKDAAGAVNSASTFAKSISETIKREMTATPKPAEIPAFKSRQDILREAREAAAKK